MRKTLIRKQFYQVTRAITGNTKTGARRKLGGIIGMAALFLLCWVSMMMAFFGTTAAFTAFFEMGLAWYYYASMALVTLAVCVVMTIFTALSTIYNAKDNELLLAMPIQPKDILFARMFEVWTLSMLFALMVAIPTMVRWLALANASALGNLFAILMFFLIPLLGVALACLVGWGVALIASKIKRGKNFMTVFLSILFLTVYYVFYFRVNKILRNVVANGPASAAAMEGTWNPLYRVGIAALGDIPSFLFIAAVCIGAFVLCNLFLSRSFLKIATTKKGSDKRVYVEKTAKASSVKEALYRKEMKHFLGSPAYMLNGGFGILIMVAAAVLLLIYKNRILEMIPQISMAIPGVDIGKYLPLAGAIAIAFMTGMNDITAPAISIEAHTLWLSKSMPITAREFFEAKIRLHRNLTVVPALVVCAAFFAVFSGGGGAAPAIDPMNGMLMIAFVILYIEFLATGGLAANVLMPNLTWTNETVAVKQSYSALIVIFGSMVFAGLIALAFWFLKDRLGPTEFLIGGIVLLALLTALLRRWLFTGGAKRYEKL